MNQLDHFRHDVWFLQIVANIQGVCPTDRFLVFLKRNQNKWDIPQPGIHAQTLTQQKSVCFRQYDFGNDQIRQFPVNQFIGLVAIPGGKHRILRVPQQCAQHFQMNFVRIDNDDLSQHGNGDLVVGL